MATVWVALVLVLLYVPGTYQEYQPNWASLDSRPLPAWYDQAKIGIFMHWGVFSVPSFGSAWFWWFWKGVQRPSYVNFMKENYRPGFTYPDFAPMFKAEMFDPSRWAKVLKSSGARYVVLTTKHHEGFTNWPSKFSWNWNSMDTGPHRDLVGDLAAAIRNETDMHFGLYHSMIEWFNPLYIQDADNNFTTQEFVRRKTMPELYELINTYKPELLWSDGIWTVDDVYWNSTHFLAWLYNNSPVKDHIVVNDRWGNNTRCHHGGYFTCRDKYNPRVLQKRKWENAMTLDKLAWTFRRNLHLADLHTMDELTEILAETISCGGNLLMNIGPTADGRIVPIFEQRLLELGEWLSVNGEAIYSSFPWTHQNDTLTPKVWYTARDVQQKRMVYAIVLDWPKTSTLTLGAVDPPPTTVITLLGYEGTFSWTRGASGGIAIHIPTIPFNRMPWRISTALLSGAASPRRLAEDTQQALSPSHIILTPGQPVAALTPIAERQAKQQQLPLLKSLVRLDPGQTLRDDFIGPESHIP